MTTAVFWVDFIDNFRYCFLFLSAELKGKCYFFFQKCLYSFVFIVNFVSIDYKVSWEILFVVTLIEQFIYGIIIKCIAFTFH